MHVCKIIVGTDKPESIPLAYWDNLDSLLDTIKTYEGEVLYTNNATIIHGCKRLHKMGYREFYIAWSRVVPPRIIELDIRGDFIQPWPDDLFDIPFHCAFGN